MTPRHTSTHFIFMDVGLSHYIDLTAIEGGNKINRVRFSKNNKFHRFRKTVKGFLSRSQLFWSPYRDQFQGLRNTGLDYKKRGWVGKSMGGWEKNIELGLSDSKYCIAVNKAANSSEQSSH